MKTTKVFFWFPLASQTAPQRKRFLKESVTVLARMMSLVISFLLVFQCLALPTLVSAETGGMRNNEQSKKTRKKKKRAKATKAGQLTSRRASNKNKASATSRAAVEDKAVDKLAQRPAVEEKAADKPATPAVAKTDESEKLTNQPPVKEKETAQRAKRPVKENEADKLTSTRRPTDNTPEPSTSRPTIIVPPFWSFQRTPAPVDTGAVATIPANPGAGQSPRKFKPEHREITVLPTVDIRELAKQKSFGMNSTAPAQLRPINPPGGVPEGTRKGVTINEAAPKEKGWETFWSKRGDRSIIASIPSPATTRTFKSDNLSLGSIPPDTMGAVGLNHVVTTTNEKVVIHDRNGVVLSTVTLDAFWAGTLGPSPNTFDPKILYDRFNDRFIFVVVANAFDPTSATLLAVSQTGDPTGTWNRYAIDADATAVAGGGTWADFPSLGFNMNWITISINRFGFGSVSGYQGPSIYVVPKAQAYTNTLGSVTVFEASFFSGCLSLPAASQPQALGCGFTYSPALTEDNTTNDHYITEDWDSGAGQLRMSRVTGTALAPVLEVGYQFPQSPYAWRFNASLISGSGGYVPQRQQNVYLPSGTRPAANDSRFSTHTVFRNGSFWAAHHVMLARLQTPAGTNVGGTANPDIRTAIQWWQINPTIVNPAAGTPPIQRNIIVDMRADNCHNGVGGTRAGCTTGTQTGDFFTFPSISVNATNDVLIGYSRFSPFTLPKAGYSFRASGDPLNTMRDPMVYREGQGNYNIGAGSPFNVRWGDYSSAMTDPVNDIDFWTIQEYALDQREIFGPGMFAGLWSTWWALIKPSTSSGTYGYGTGLIISEFRMRGPAGPRDEFVELINPTDEPITVFSSDGTDGWTLVYSSPGGTITPLATIPNGTVIPARGHYLITNEVRAAGIAPYSLSLNPTGNPVRTADSDAMWTPDLADNGGFAIFRTANQANFILATRMDAAGFSTLPAGSIYREGNGLPPCAGAPAPGEQVSFTRKGTAGNPQDTNSNENDFNYVSSTGASAQVCQPLSPGTPTPLNLDSPPSAP